MSHYLAAYVYIYGVADRNAIGSTRTGRTAYWQAGRSLLNGSSEQNLRKKKKNKKKKKKKKKNKERKGKKENSNCVPRQVPKVQMCAGN